MAVNRQQLLFEVSTMDVTTFAVAPVVLRSRWLRVISQRGGRRRWIQCRC